MNYFEKGQSIWTYEEIENSLDEFLEIYEKRPFDTNLGGMNAPHMLAFWFVLKKINPKYVVENGVWKGHGTWLIKNTLPNAKIYSLDPNLHFREIIFDDVEYSSEDFSSHLWKEKVDVSSTLAFFDDHQNALERIRQCKEAEIKHLIFEDNYPPGMGDCYSPKMIYGQCGFSPKKAGISDLQRTLRGRLRKFFGRKTHQYLHFSKPLQEIPPNSEDFEYFDQTIDIYHEFPPVFKSTMTRDGKVWEDEFSQPKSVLDLSKLTPQNKIFMDQADTYTWFCYLKLI